MARVNSNQFAAAGTILAAPGTLSLVSGFNPTLTDRYFQVFDRAAPVAGDVPVQSILVLSLGNFSYVPTPLLAPFGIQCTWAVSSTPELLTPAPELFWVHGEASSQ